MVFSAMQDGISGVFDGMSELLLFRVVIKPEPYCSSSVRNSLGNHDEVIDVKLTYIWGVGPHE